jgi:hypothetical protein
LQPSTEIKAFLQEKPLLALSLAALIWALLLIVCNASMQKPIVLPDEAYLLPILKGFSHQNYHR